MALNKPFARGYFVAHEHVEDFVGFDGLFDAHLEDGTLGRVHCSVPESFGVHFAETFVATYLWLFAVMSHLIFFDDGVTLFVAVDVADLLADFDVEERRLRDIQVPIRDNVGHVTEEEGQEQRANVCSVNVGVAHDNDAAITQLRHVEVFVDTNTDGGDNVLDLFTLEYPVKADALNVQDFTA